MTPISVTQGRGTHQAGCAHDFACARAVGAGFLPTVAGSSLRLAGGHTAMPRTIPTSQITTALQDQSHCVMDPATAYWSAPVHYNMLHFSRPCCARRAVQRFISWRVLPTTPWFVECFPLLASACSRHMLTMSCLAILQGVITATCNSLGTCKIARQDCEHVP